MPGPDDAAPPAEAQAASSDIPAADIISLIARRPMGPLAACLQNQDARDIFLFG